MNAKTNSATTFTDLGLIDYKEAWDYQASLFNDILAIKSSNRNLPEEEQAITKNFLLFCEHPHVYTLGKSGDEKNLLLDQTALKQVNASYYHINRGGDITYHGPGQLIVYPVIDMENFFTDIHKYMRLLEEAVILTCQTYGVESGRIAGLTGVWLGDAANENERKISALGVKTSRWVTMHGLAFNVNTDLSYFNHIVPCGIDDKAVTSLQQELGRPIDMEEVKQHMKKHLTSLFGMQLVRV
ncbi:lipoate-protein ligase B [Chryseotalea sanaruensis]|uniref:Octanoyltransferase n=1 Tax=Chryseotalea sanaruensis TaxID=2482724 RepID=A0A401U7U6_9BACT|nr:lipoyl(octanoyl) transferase LipB [Chryseotalea sanaruensis]GCC50969.1 lipoate-protein ligase B [Chryseotalea sanaruensis]